MNKRIVVLKVPKLSFMLMVKFNHDPELYRICPNLLLMLRDNEVYLGLKKRMQSANRITYKRQLIVTQKKEKSYLYS